MRSESGFRRLVSFADAVVAIAITLLILPLVDSASSIGSSGVGPFLEANKFKLFAFALSFVVIADFWWSHHQMFEQVKEYNVVLVWGMFLWLFSIVFLPFPTELVGSAKGSSVATHAIYIGTMLVTAIAALVQQWSVVRWPELLAEGARGSATISHALILAILMATALTLATAVPAIGLWSLLVLGLSRPIERLASRARTRV